MPSKRVSNKKTNKLNKKIKLNKNIINISNNQVKVNSDTNIHGLQFEFNNGIEIINRNKNYMIESSSNGKIVVVLDSTLNSPLNNHVLFEYVINNNRKKPKLSNYLISDNQSNKIQNFIVK